VPDVAAATAKIEASNRNDLAILREDTAPAIVRACLALQKDLLAANRKPRDPRFTPEAAGVQLMGDLAAARAKANQALDASEQGMRQAESNIRDDLRAKTEPKLDTQEQLVLELQKAAARRQLDLMASAGVETDDQISALAAQGNLVGLKALREDLGLGLLKSALGRDTLLQLLDQTETPLLSAMETAKRQIEEELKWGLSQQVTGLGIARMFAAGQRSMPTILPAWAKGQTLVVAFTTPDGGIDVPPTPSSSGSSGVPGNPGIAAANAARQAAVDASVRAANAGRPNRDGQ
jgi:hypothetical protein